MEKLMRMRDDEGGYSIASLTPAGKWHIDGRMLCDLGEGEWCYEDDHSTVFHAETFAGLQQGGAIGELLDSLEWK